LFNSSTLLNCNTTSPNVLSVLLTQGQSNSVFQILSIQVNNILIPSQPQLSIVINSATYRYISMTGQYNLINNYNSISNVISAFKILNISL